MFLYYWDDNNHYDHSVYFKDESQLPKPLPLNATKTVPVDGLYGQPTWTGQTWIGMSKEDWLAQNPLPTPEPTTQDEANASILLRIAQNKEEQDKFNAQIMLSLAEKGGNN